MCQSVKNWKIWLLYVDPSRHRNDKRQIRTRKNSIAEEAKTEQIQPWMQHLYRNSYVDIAIIQNHPRYVNIREVKTILYNTIQYYTPYLILLL